MPRLTKEPWFGPKRVGFGLSPVSWQGWLATALFVLLGVAALRGLPQPASVVAAFALIVGYILVLVFTSSPPGHR